MSSYHTLASMGPRPDGRGTRSRERAYSTPWPGFNGAATGWPRNAPPLRASRSESSGFNGAATGWPRNVGKSCRGACHADSFNGAATGWPRNGQVQNVAHPVHLASMGPRPDGRGTSSTLARAPATRTSFNGAATGWPRNGLRGAYEVARGASLQWGRDRMAAERGLETVRLSSVGMASMGPRPDGRGTLCVINARGSSGLASMGPRPDGRGTAALFDWEIGAPLLQWGRDRMAAERRREPSLLALRYALQWGRDRMAAERAPVRGWGWAAGGASMGPRPDGRGTITRGRNVIVDFKLQWGRDRMAAERWRVWGRLPDPNRFNGAATGWPRNAC